jgi:hypothetical protein
MVNQVTYGNPHFVAGTCVARLSHPTRTLPSFQLASSRIFSIRKLCWLTSGAASLRVRVSSRSSWIARSRTKFERIRPRANRSAIHFALFTSVLRPGTFMMCEALASTSSFFQNMPHRFPVIAGRLHCHLRATVRAQLIGSSPERW